MTTNCKQTALDRCLKAIEASTNAQKAQREAIQNMPRVQLLEAYAERHEKALQGLHWFLHMTRSEFYLARAARRLIYLNYNRVACVAIGRGKFASDKTIMADVKRLKAIARGARPLPGTITVIEAGGVHTFDVAQAGAA